MFFLLYSRYSAHLTRVECVFWCPQRGHSIREPDTGLAFKHPWVTMEMMHQLSQGTPVRKENTEPRAKYTCSEVALSISVKVQLKMEDIFSKENWVYSVASVPSGMMIKKKKPAQWFTADSHANYLALILLLTNWLLSVMLMDDEADGLWWEVMSVVHSYCTFSDWIFGFLWSCGSISFISIFSWIWT